MPDYGNTRKVGGTAASVLSLASAVYLQNNPSWGMQHPHLVTLLYGFAFALCVFTAVQWPIVQKVFGIYHETPFPPSNTPSSVATKVHAPATAIASPVTNINFGSFPTLPTPEKLPEPTASAGVPPLIPKLKIRREARNIRYEVSSGCWVLSSGGETDSIVAVLLWVENPVAEKDTHGITATDVVAHLKFHHVLGTTSVPRAYWVGHRSNQIDIRNGFEFAVVIGHLEGKKFYAYENSSSSDMYDAFDIPFRPLKKAYDISAERSFNVDISIIDAESSRTIERRRIEISMPHVILNLVEI
jgi:hypothetical protein